MARFLPVVVLLVWQLAMAAPAHAKAGDLDRSFGSGGKVTTDFAGQTDEAFALAAQADGRLVAAGFMLSEFGEMDFALARYRA